MDEPKRYDYYYDGSLERCDDSGDYCRYDDPAIVQALAIRQACAEAGLLDENGNLRQIIGTLPVTADGAIVGGNALVFLTEHGKVTEFITDNFCGLCRHLGDGCCHTFVSMHRSAGVLHSTREAAERAAKERSDCERSEQGANDGQ